MLNCHRWWHFKNHKGFHPLNIHTKNWTIANVHVWSKNEKGIYFCHFYAAIKSYGWLRGNIRKIPRWKIWKLHRTYTVCENVPKKKMEKYMLSVSSEERHFWSLVVSLMNNTSHHTKDTPVIAQKIYQKTSSCSSQDFLQNVKFPWLQSISKNPHKEKHLFDAKLLILSPLPAA